MNRFLLLLSSLFYFQTATGQGVAINTTGAPAAGSAMLDITSTTKGMLIPRMTTAQRNAIVLPAPGLLVFDITTNSFWFRTAAAWVQVTDNFHGLRDADHDTQVQVEESPDEDIIRFDAEGDEVMYIEKNSNQATRIDVGPNLGLIIGRLAGVNSFAGWNTILGPHAGQFNTTGQFNVMIGYKAGEDNGGQNRNVFIGAESGANNTGGFNSFLGYRSGYVNTTGHSNTFLGNEAGVQNTTGYRNAFVGYLAGHNNETSFENTFIGGSAGYNNEAERNTFLGYEAGLANRTGIYNVVLGGEAAGTNLSARDMGDGNTIAGYEAGQLANGLHENVLVGYRAGYNLTSGIRNVLIGANSGYSTQTAFANVGVGPGTLRSLLSGNRNVAVGDSALYSNLSSVNVAVGSRAGMDNTSGSGNTFVGNQAGMRNTTGADNTFLGNHAGNFNKTGIGNVAVGDEAGNANSDGDFNVFVGLAAGFRNETGNENVFAGRQAGEHTTSGNANIAIGLRAGNQNQTGTRNIAIGEYALGHATGTQISTSNNIAIGYNAGSNATGTSNVIIGNSSGNAIANINNVLLGNNITSYGYNNTFLGTQTGTNLFASPIGATAVGYNTQITQDYSVILGDASNILAKVGIGTNTPDAKLEVNATSGDILHLHNDVTEAMTVRFNGDIIMNQDVMINTTSKKTGYELNVDGDIVCEEVLVEDATNWPDYVFKEDYALKNMDELREFVTSHHHLPNIPSALEIEKEGILLGNMQKKLLEKIEELTLYILELESRLTEVENKLPIQVPTLK